MLGARSVGQVRVLPEFVSLAQLRGNEMKPPLRMYGVVGLIVCAFGSLSSAQIRLLVIPRGEDPANFPSGTTVIDALPGDRVCVEFWATGAPDDVFGLQLVIEDAVGGDSGTVAIDCPSIAIDTAHPRYIGITDLPLANSDFCPIRANYFFAHLTVDAFVTIPSAGAYLAQLCYNVSPDARGQFVASWVNPEVQTNFLAPGTGAIIPGVVYDNVVINACDPSECPDGGACTSGACAGGACVQVPNTYGDVDHNGAVNLFDLICVLKGISGQFGPCTLEAVDISPCTPDGAVSIFDLFAVLNALSDADPCCGAP